MSDGFSFTDYCTRRWFRTTARSTRSAAILDLLALLVFHKCHGFFAEEVNLVRTHLEDFGRTDFRALAATIAPVRVDGNIPVARPVPKTVIGYHFCFLFAYSWDVIRNPCLGETPPCGARAGEIRNE